MNTNRILSLYILLCCLTVTGIAQTQPTNKATATVSGRIMIGDQPAAGVEVMLRQTGSDGTIVIAGFEPSAPITATTDGEGRYKIVGVAAGGYRIAAYAPAYVVAGESRNRFDQGKALNIAEGENVESVDFALTRGGVVTGKVTDEYGKPVIAEAVSVHRIDDSGKRITQNAPNFTRWETDDRGVYRIFGLEPGRYLVSAGASSEDATVRAIGGAGGFYQRTFHPDAVEEAQAKIIELKSGAEIESIDIRIARAKKGYVATGRVIESENGALTSFNLPVGVPDDKGAFLLRNLRPGRQRIEWQLPDENWYAKSMTLTGATPANDPRNGLALKSGDRVTGLTITLATGATGVKGKVAATAGARLPSRLRVHLLPAETDAKDDLLRFAEVRAESDGAFSFNHLAPGKYLILASAIPDSEPTDKPARPAIWDATERTKLRKEAEAANIVIELKACQRVTEYALRFPK